VGLRNLLQASRDSGVEVSYKWEPFFLNPDHPQEEGENILVHLRKKYGPSIESRIPSLEAAGHKVGINFTRDRNTINTLKCHMLTEFAYKNYAAEIGNKVMESLFKKYFEEGINVSSNEVLVAIAADCGIDSSGEALQAINSGELAAEVKLRASQLQGDYRGEYVSVLLPLCNSLQLLSRSVGSSIFHH
jgi:predicted DsbA family dithiol-disulfide isomerase